MSSHDEVISNFTSITGTSTERAKFYLESSGWQLAVALASFYENDGDGGDSEPEVIGPPTIINQDSDDEVVSQPSSESASAAFKATQKTTNSRFATLANLSKDTGSSDEEEGQAFYAGGSEHSGQQVLGPGKKKKDFVTEMFQSVKMHGAEVVEPKDSGHGGKRPSTFTGTGYRLGQSANDTEVVQLPSASRRESLPTEVTLKLWKEGFSVDSGPLREYSDPDNREFLDYVRRGEVPQELLMEAKGGEVHLNMEDHRHETFVTSKVKVKAFGGKGHLLGSPSPTTVGSTKALDEKDKVANEQEAKSSFYVDPNAPKTTVQIRLADGSRLVATLNHTQTIGDLRRYIVLARPQYEHQPFNLLTTFPSKELSDNNQTLAQAGILNAAILQRLV